MDLLDLWEEAEEYRVLRESLGRGSQEHTVLGLTGSQKTFLAAALWRHAAGSALMVVSGTAQAERVAQDVATWLGATGEGSPVAVFPPREVLPYEVVGQSREQSAERLRILGRLLSGERLFLVASVDALLGRLTPAPVMRAAYRRVAVGDALSLSDFAAWLAAVGYERADVVEGPGQFAVRGGLVDLWDPTWRRPVRVELFGDEVESLREFSPEDQRSVGSRSEVRLGPARELVFTPEVARRGVAAIRRELQQLLSPRKGQPPGEQAQRLAARVEELLATWGEMPSGDAPERFHPYFYPEPGLLSDYLPSGAIVLLDEPLRLKEAAGDAERLSLGRTTALLQEGAILPGQGQVWVPWSKAEDRLSAFPRVVFSLLSRRAGQESSARVVSFAAKPVESFHGQFRLFVQELERVRHAGRRAVLFAATEDRARRLVDALHQEGIPARPCLGGEEREARPLEPLVVVGALEEGFQLPGLSLWVATDAEIYGRTKRRRRAAPAPEHKSQGRRLETFQDLKPGDYVVHVHHGIGRYVGLRTMDVMGVRKDYLHLEYAGGDTLYVPVEQIDLVQKYVGQEGQEPRLYRLGGTDWQKVKSRVKESVREMAGELLRLYAAREARPGYAFSPDTPWQKELEDSFPYEETPDQLRAIEEVKRDMERPRPMDRLLCGDVGYGKTEVAIRAAFKAAMDGKQVAVLVPTTILAQQHYNTFTQRFAGFPVRVELLSRFRSPREQEEVLRRVADGRADVVIGTHRLLSPDVRFKELGLVIVDEEQRFGVAHKERLKVLKERVDVLTLTATPIPRTLHMSLVGLRDMSLIETPPEDRYPVQTYVVEWDEDLVQSAIRRELARGGQVFYVHNRVDTIDNAVSVVRRLVPEARVAVAHGQMREDQLERTMLDFLDGEYDVLVATTIVESGLDIPRVNTLIVEDSDRLGLAQMYQLRGRIGRSNRQAYAYFTYRPDKVISEVAEKRLEAIREFTEFGAGYKIAMRDLEIRGSGNILGPEQHGHIVQVGFDLYVQLLEEAVRELKGEAPPEEPVYPSIELAVDAYLPDSYVPDPRQKIDLYKRIAALRSLAEVEDLAEEMADRYGPLPKAAENLLAVARLKIRGAEIGLLSIQRERDRYVLKFENLHRLPGDRVVELGRQFRGRAVVHAGQTPHVTWYPAPSATPDTVLRVLEEILVFLTPQAVSA